MYVRLKILRKSNKLTQKFIAEKLNTETGEKSPAPMTEEEYKQAIQEKLNQIY